jgi:hypothetical protein
MSRSPQVSRHKWYVAGVGLRQDDNEWWLGEPTGGAFNYWWEKDGNVYTDAVFHYFAKNQDAAERLADLRRDELAAGWQPLPPLSHGDELEPDDDHAATDGPPPLHLPHKIASAVVWRLASELVRRHPDRLWVYPEGGGLYDRVTLVDRAGSTSKWLLTMNANGSNSNFESGQTMHWTAVVRDGADPFDWIREAEEMCGLPKPSNPIPSSTPASLVPRLVASFLANQVASRFHWWPSSSDALPREEGWHLQLVEEWCRAHPGREFEVVFLRRHR